jgi:hypothetical protein
MRAVSKYKFQAAVRDGKTVVSPEQKIKLTLKIDQ